MPSLSTLAAALSSLAVRILCYIFFRWIPGHHFPPLIYTFAIVYYAFLPYDRGFPSHEKAQIREDLSTNGVPLEAKGQRGRTEEKRGYWQILKIWGLGLPHPDNRPWNTAAVGVNLLLLFGVVDVVYRGSVFFPSHDISFARVGYVSDNTANILVREPDPSQLPIFLSYRATPDSGLDVSWKAAGSIMALSNTTDYTSTLEIKRLQAVTRYQYATSNNLNGTFMTAPHTGQTANSRFTFLTSSCIKPQFPYNPLSHPLTIPGLKHLADWIPKLQAQFMLFLGDFIYIDVPHRAGTSPEAYRSEYRRVYASPSWPPVSQSLPWLHVIDDHEIANDWDGGWSDPYPAAIDPWAIYHASVNPPPAEQNASYFSFRQGPASFFMLDTRRHRSSSTALPPTDPTKSMLGPAQMSSLLHFLKRDEPAGIKWKFVISSIPFTRNWRLNAADTWAGYLHERRTILEAMWDTSSRGDGIGVVILSGDRHEFAATAFPPPKDAKWPSGATVHEFSTSPLSMFYLPVRSYWEVPSEAEDGYGSDVCVKYAPDGNSKFGIVDLEEVKGGEQGVLRFRLVVDGVETWEYVLMTPPVKGGGGWGVDAVWG